MPSIISFEGCTHVDLSSRSTTALLHAVTVVADSKDASGSKAMLADTVYDILDQANVDISLVLEDFGPSIQQWCPIVPEDFLKDRQNHASYEQPPHEETYRPFLLLCLWLMSRRPCDNAEHITRCQLYRALKQSLAIFQSGTNVNISILQASMLLALYETSHGMSNQAFQTMSASVGILQLLQHSATKSANLVWTLEWIKPSLLMLDRVLTLTSPTHLPLALPSYHTTTQCISYNLAPEIPPHPPLGLASATSARKLHIRSTVALATSPALEYISSLVLNPPPQPNHAYDTATSSLTTCIQALVSKPEPHTWLHCDAIALAFCTNILLQEAQMRHLSSTLPVLAGRPHPEYEKVHLALKYARHMAWDMVKVGIQKINGEGESGEEGVGEVGRLPFAGLCCVVRAGVAVLKTREFYADGDCVEEKEVEGFKRVVELFAGRWGVGQLYLRTSK